MVPRLRPRWLASRLAGLLMAVLALASQVAVGAIVLPDEAAARDQSVAMLDAATIFCDSTSVPDQPPPPRHHVDCALCPLTAAMATPCAVLASGPELPTPTTRRIGRIALPPPARGPPPQPRPTPPSRGPPVLS